MPEREQLLGNVLSQLKSKVSRGLETGDRFLSNFRDWWMNNVAGPSNWTITKDDLVGPTPTPTPMPTPTPTPTQRPQIAGAQAPQQVTPEQLQSGFAQWGGGQAPPIATVSSQLAQAGQGLPDPLLPAILSLMESRGLLDLIPAQNANPFNIMYPGTGTPVKYPSLDAAILGGEGKLGLSGLLRPGGMYEPYLQSGNLSDFFTKFTPPGGSNPSMDELISRYMTLRDLFVQ